MSEADAVRQGMREIDFVLHSSWRLGKTIVAGWTYQGNRVSFCFSEPYNVLGRAEQSPRLIRGKRMMGARTFSETCKLLRARAITMDLPFSIGQGSKDVSPLQIENLVKRYTVISTTSRAVILFDIVGFSKHTALEQVAQLSSLEYSINAANKRMNEAGMRTELARSTVGDGFYVWNRNKGLEHDLRTWLALILILTDNALARQKGDPRLVPKLRAAFAVGSHFSYHQVEGNTPRGFEYIVGDVTITLARIIAKAMPGQILLGQFTRDATTIGQPASIDALGFLAYAEKVIPKLLEIEVGHAAIADIRSSVTKAGTGSRSAVAIYNIRDKHGYTHQAFNMRVTVERNEVDTLTLGLLNEDLRGFEAEPGVYGAKPVAAR